jgi:hypothetical protein
MCGAVKAVIVAQCISPTRRAFCEVAGLDDAETVTVTTTILNDRRAPVEVDAWGLARYPSGTGFGNAGSAASDP